MKTLSVSAKILWILLSTWSAIVLLVAVSCDWETMDRITKFFTFGAMFPIFASIAWTLPKRWRLLETVDAIVTGTSALCMFAIASGWSLAATTDASEAPVRFAAGVFMALNGAFLTFLAFYSYWMDHKRRVESWHRTYTAN